MNDPYDNGTPKYSTAQDIYDALCELVQTEEMGILMQMFPDVSTDNQGYYYTDIGYGLKERFDQLIDYGDKMWVMNLAVWQIDQAANERLPEIHDLVYDALINSDLARRIGFKKLFIDHMLRGFEAEYAEVAEEFASELGDLNRFDNMEMIKAFNRVMNARGESTIVTPYPTFCFYLREKLQNLRLQKEGQIIVECRALLTSYDDFMLGLRMNQTLYEQLEQQYRSKTLWLQESYEEKVRQLILIAENQGINLQLPGDAVLPAVGQTK